MVNTFNVVNPEVGRRDPAEPLGELATSIKDVMEGFEALVERAEPDLRPVVERFLDLHRDHTKELFSVLSRLGGDPEQAGSFMSSVHEAVAAVRDWAGNLDLSALDKILEGEEELLKKYTETIPEVDGDPDAVRVLEKQRDALAERVHAERA